MVQTTFVCGHGAQLLILAVFVKDALQDRAVALCDLPVGSHLREGVDEEDEVGAYGVGDGGAADEEETRANPECEGERGAESVQQVVGYH